MTSLLARKQARGAASALASPPPPGARSSTGSTVFRDAAEIAVSDAVKSRLSEILGSITAIKEELRCLASRVDGVAGSVASLADEMKLLARRVEAESQLAADAVLKAREKAAEDTLALSKSLEEVESELKAGQADLVVKCAHGEQKVEELRSDLEVLQTDIAVLGEALTLAQP